MQGHIPVRHNRAQRIFSRFCMDMEMLPPYTPLFLVDESGHITNKKGLKTSKTDFESLYNLVSQAEAQSLFHKMHTCDAYAVSGKLDDGKNFIVISGDSDGFSRCVVCSYSEKGCVKLHDYIEKLCSYKDYLDSFSNLAFSSMARLPVKRLFKIKLSGALELAELSAGTQNDSQRRISFPIGVALDKLAEFVAKSGGGSIELLRQGSDFDCVVNVPELFFKLMVSAMANAVRYGRNGKVQVSAKALPRDKSVRITLLAKGGEQGEAVYEKALVRAFEARGMLCGIREYDGEYMFYVDLPVKDIDKAVVSDVDVVLKEIDGLMSEQALSDLYFTIADI